ncbi:globin, partial [Dimargaris cristalligena]
EQLLATVVHKIYEYCLADDRVRHYFRSTDRTRLSNMQLKFLKHAIAGTPYNTTGMRVAHRRMVDLKDYHFDAILENWRKAFIDCGVPDDYTELILAVAEQSRDDILGR